MLNQQTLSILHSLKLFGLAKSFEERLSDPKQAELSHAEFVGLLIQDERTYRDNLRLRRLLRKAKLRQEASLEDIDYGASRGLSQQVILELANPGWVAAHRLSARAGRPAARRSNTPGCHDPARARAASVCRATSAPWVGRLFRAASDQKPTGQEAPPNDSGLPDRGHAFTCRDGYRSFF